ncbi:MAG: hypothetical protein ABSG31_17635 [Tepidisphaeraceae bacterium]
MILTLFTLFHVAISLVGIISGLVVALALLKSKRSDCWTMLFLATTALTSITGFMFPFHGFKPSYVLGILSLIVLTPAYIARYRKRMAGHWRAVYVITAMIALYFNVFVLIVQSFMKVPALHALAPTQSEPPFAITQLIVLVIFIVLTILAAIKFHPEKSGIAGA